jgi:hypothetical protein
MDGAYEFLSGGTYLILVVVILPDLCDLDVSCLAEHELYLDGLHCEGGHQALISVCIVQVSIVGRYDPAMSDTVFLGHEILREIDIQEIV